MVRRWKDRKMDVRWADGWQGGERWDVRWMGWWEVGCEVEVRRAEGQGGVNGSGLEPESPAERERERARP